MNLPEIVKDRHGDFWVRVLNEDRYTMVNVNEFDEHEPFNTFAEIQKWSPLTEYVESHNV